MFYFWQTCSDICSAATNEHDRYLLLSSFGFTPSGWENVILSGVIILLQWSIIQRVIRLEKAKETPVSPIAAFAFKGYVSYIFYTETTLTVLFLLSYRSLLSPPTQKTHSWTQQVLRGWTKVILENMCQNKLWNLDCLFQDFLSINLFGWGCSWEEGIFLLAPTSLDLVYRCVGKLPRQWCYSNFVSSR